jgi:hypothetical protein
MRTAYDLEKMAALTLQIYDRNLDEWQPIVATPNGEGYHIISGHRRHMACLFAFALDDWREKQKSTEGPATIETVREMLSTLVNKHGDVETAAEALIAHYGEREISFALFEGDEKSQILALHPDVMGVALSFRLALVAGATIEQIARNAGVHVRYVENHLALTEIPRALAERIAAGGLPMSVAATVADMPDPRRSGLALFILANPAGSLTAREIKECAAELKKWPGLQMPLTTAHQAQRNIARALVQLWGQVIDAYPEDAWAAAAMLVYRGQHLAPWADAAKTSLWFQVLGGETYYGDDGVHWAKVVAHLLNEVSCKACPVAQLPQQQLQSDLGQGQRGALGMLEALQQAWQAQAQLEAAENSARAEPAIDEPGDGEVTIDQSHNAAAQAVTQTKGPGSPSLIEKQRELIADFMQQHLKLIDTHPMATACRRCRHRLESSPTKDESVPHCAWAGRLRNVAFKTWQPTGGNGPVIPVCRQFAPVENWPDIIPEHPQPPGVPREWLKQTILQLVEACGNFGAGRQPFEFLTGRPMSGSEHYNTWFADQLNEQVGNLSDGQLWTLFTWAVSEWQRAKKHDCFTMPVNGSGAQFLDYQEVKWQLQAGAEQGRREAAS